MHGGIGTTEGIASIFLFCMLGWIAHCDIRTFRIPDRASLLLIAAGLWLSTLPGGIQTEESLFGAAVGFSVFAMLGAVYFRRTGQDGLGLGDAKLLAAAGAWLGWRDLPTLVAGAAVAALAFALLTRQRRLAFGPWLAGVFWILWLRGVAR